MRRLLILGCVILIGCSSQNELSTQAGATILLRSQEGTEIPVRIEIADTHSERQKGLMFRESLELDAGMLFVFDTPGMHAMWMKNTLIPLDMISFDSEKFFVSSVTAVPCDKKKCPLYTPASDILFTLEVPAGFTKVHEIGEGWRIIMSE
jgi:uncharacterized protein